jgi:hypothetical protein
MSKGFGRVQLACLNAIKACEVDNWPTTYTIAADVYEVVPDKHGNRLINDAQHVAVKRALGGLQVKGVVIGFRDASISRDRGESNHAMAIRLGEPPVSIKRRRAEDDGRVQQCHIWMTEAGLALWLERARDYADFCGHAFAWPPGAGRMDQ